MDIKETGIEHFKSHEGMLNALNGHFKALSVEKYPQAMLNFLMEKSFTKVFEKYRSGRISQALQDRCKLELIQEFRRYYGEWANIYDFDLKKGRFKCNFETIYKTGLGRLYGSNPGSIHDHLFYTSHCFEQYKERGDCYKAFPLLTLAFKRVRNTTPTPADLLKFATLGATMHCVVGTSIFVCVDNGVLVLDRLSGGILIAKTFLLPDMDYPKSGWLRTKGFCLDTTDIGVEVCKKKGYEAVKLFFPEKETMSYQEYVEVMKYQVTSVRLDI